MSININKVLQKVVMMFTIIFILSLPFQYNLLKIGFLRVFFEQIVVQIAPLFLDNTDAYTLTFYSDSTGMYLNILCVLFVSMVLTFFWILFEKRVAKTINLANLYQVFLIVIVYYLSLQMCIYGFSKLFKYQFYDAHPNTLFTPVGYLTKDFLYWTSIGSSKLYNTIVGSIELLVGFLLWFKSVRPLGAILGLILSINVVLVNFAFDINVKIQSLFFLFLFLLVSYSALKKIYFLFFKGKVITTHQRSLPFSKMYNRIVTTVAIVLILVESLYPYVKNNNFNGDTLIKPPFYGAYKIKGDQTFKRFFIHSDPYFIIQDNEDNLFSFSMEVGIDNMVLKNNQSSTTLVLKSQDSILSLKGDFFGHPLDIQAAKIDIEKMPLLQDSFQWTIDQYK